MSREKQAAEIDRIKRLYIEKHNDLRRKKEQGNYTWIEMAVLGQLLLAQGDVSFAKQSSAENGQKQTGIDEQKDIEKSGREVDGIILQKMTAQPG